MLNKKNIKLISLGCSLIFAFNMSVTAAAVDGGSGRGGIFSAGIENVFSPKKTVSTSKTAAAASGTVKPVSGTVSTFSGVYTALTSLQNITLENKTSAVVSASDTAVSASSVEASSEPAANAASSNVSAAASDTSPAVKQNTAKSEDSVSKSDAVKVDREGLTSNRVLSVAEDYVNVRESADKDSEVVGKFYSNNIGTLVASEGEWIKIQSGNVTGYVKSEYCLTGEEAEKKLKDASGQYATVAADSLNIRLKADMDSEVMDVVEAGARYEVKEEQDDWVKVAVTDEYEGFLYKDYIKLSNDYSYARTVEEEEKLSEKSDEIRKNLSKDNKADVPAQYAAPKAPAVYATTSSGTGQDVIDFAMQFLGNPYVYGGSSLTNGTDCSGFTMAVYSNFGVSLPHGSYWQLDYGTAVENIESAVPGDLIIYKGHVALYIGGGQIIHASTERTGICIGNAYYDTPIGIRRIFT